MKSDKDYKGFLLIRTTYKVQCMNRACPAHGRVFEAALGEEPIDTEERDGADWCPVCNCLSLVAADVK